MSSKPNPNGGHHDMQMPKECSKGNSEVTIIKKCDEKNKKPVVNGHLLLPPYDVVLDLPDTSHLGVS